MPRNGSGTYTVPITYTPNTLASAADVNSNFTDVATAMTGSLPRDGQAGMSGQMKLADGALATPGLTFDADQDTGIRRSGANTIRLVCGGVDIAEVSAAGLALLSGALSGSGTIPIGAGMDYWLPAPAPTGWILCYAQVCPPEKTALRAALIAAGYPYGQSGSDPLLPDKRGRASFGKDDMGGTSANRITNQSGGWNGDTLGGAGGAETHTLTEAQMPSHTHTGSALSASPTNPTYIAYQSNVGVQAGSSDTVPRTASAVAVQVSGDMSHTHSLSINSTGGGGAHNNLPPGISCNYIIFAGA
jgi:microcystin-dependent protein